MAPGVGGTKAALRALLGGLWLCACTGSGALDDGGPPGTSANETCGSNTSCKRCDVASDCDQGRGLGGYACVFPEMRANEPAVQEMTRADDERRLAISSLSAEDAGEDLDAGPVMEPKRMAPQSRGKCSTECDTKLCTDPGSVCTSLHGYCEEGCDETRPTCPDGQVCDFSPRKKHCYALNGRCRTASDCPVFDDRLIGGRARARGVVSCEAERCRYTPSAPDLTSPVQSTLALDALPELRVDSPQPGDRILPADLPSFTFQFAAPTQVIVAAILTREPKSLEDGAAAALWTAYLDGKRAWHGVTLADGGAMVDGAWQRHQDADFKLPEERQLYFLVIGYDRGERVAQSKLVPFSVGARRPKAGDVCEGKDGEFCAQDSALLCMESVCRTPCLSDDDCASEERCFVPSWLGVAARVCR